MAPVRTQRPDFLRAWLMLAAVAVGVRTLGLRRVRDLLARANAARRGDREDTPEQLAAVVAAAARWCVAGRSCLARSVVLEWMLARRGVPAELKVGVRRSDRGIEAHAWVEVNGLPLDERRDIAATFHAFEGLRRLEG